jgi:rRNA maturation endonuclease Nob1
MAAQIPEDCNPALVTIAREVCSSEGINFDSLNLHQTRGLMYFWCSSCSGTHPLTDLVISRKKKICTHCGNSVKLHATSNKFGKVRRMIFFKHLSEHAQ